MSNTTKFEAEYRNRRQEPWQEYDSCVPGVCEEAAARQLAEWLDCDDNLWDSDGLEIRVREPGAAWQYFRVTAIPTTEYSAEACDVMDVTLWPYLNAPQEFYPGVVADNGPGAVADLLRLWDLRHYRDGLELEEATVVVSADVYNTAFRVKRLYKAGIPAGVHIVGYELTEVPLDTIQQERSDEHKV